MVDADFNFKMPKIEMVEQSPDEKYGRFVVEPLERVIWFNTWQFRLEELCFLSLVEVLAVSSLKIDGVLHEFSSIPGVKRRCDRNCYEY